MKKAIIIGASSGIGRELAKILAENGYRVGLTGRRAALLEELQNALGQKSFVKTLDVTRTGEAAGRLEELIDEMRGVELIVVNAGIGFINPELEWAKESATIETNVAGFAAMAGVAFRHFEKRAGGHLVGISSLAALRGSGAAPAYNASKAFVSSYLEGLRQKAAKLSLPITVTDIQPGLVDTAMAQGDGLFWVAPPEKAARQIFNAVRRGRRHAYVTKRWRAIAWLLKLAPDRLYHKM